MSIQSMRDKSDGIVAKIIVGLIIIVFAAFGMGSITTFLAPVPTIAKVNGDDITQAEMEAAFQRQLNAAARQGKTLTPEDEFALQQDVIQGLIDRKLMAQVTDAMGMGYSVAAIDNEILTTEAFSIDGQFNPQQFQLLLANAGYDPIKYRRELRIDQMIGQLNAGVGSSGFLTRSEAQRLIALTQQKRDIAFLRLEVAPVGETIAVSAEDIAALYAENQDEYQSKEEIDIAYIEIMREDFLDQVEITEEALKTFFEDTKDVYAEPERRRSAHILLLIPNDVPEQDVLERANNLHQQLIAGADFADLARAHSEDPASAENGGDLGFAAPGAFVKAFELAASGLQVGGLSAPIKTEFGYHIIKLLDIDKAKESEFEAVRENVLQEFKLAEAEQLFIEQSAKLSELAFESADLEGPATDLGLQVKTSGFVSRDNTAEDSSSEIATSPQVLAAVFSADVLVDGNNSDLIEITPTHHLVARAHQHKPQFVQNLADVSDAISLRIKHERAEVLVAEKARAALALLESGSIAAYVADQAGLEWQVVAAAARNQRDMDEEINAEAFKLPRPAEGDKSVGYALLLNGDAVIISVTNVLNKPVKEIDTEELATFSEFFSKQQGFIAYQEFTLNLAQTGSVSR